MHVVVTCTRAGSGHAVSDNETKRASSDRSSCRSVRRKGGAGRGSGWSGRSVSSGSGNLGSCDVSSDDDFRLSSRRSSCGF